MLLSYRLEGQQYLAGRCERKRLRCSFKNSSRTLSTHEVLFRYLAGLPCALFLYYLQLPALCMSRTVSHKNIENPRFHAGFIASFNTPSLSGVITNCTVVFSPGRR